MPDHPNVAIFWDYENCSPSSNSSRLGYDIVNNIRRIARLFGSVTTFRAYLDVSAQSPKSVTLRSELQSSGVSMIDCPHNGKKDVVDKMILVDMLAFAVDHPAPATIFLITGDRDYSYAVSTLRLRTYQVVLVVPSPQTSPCLESQASLVIDWGAAILRSRTEAVSSTQAIRQHCLDLDPNLTTKLLRELQDLIPEDPEAALLHPYSADSPNTSRVRRTSARDILEHSKHSKNIGSTDSTREFGYNQTLSRKFMATGSDSVPVGLPIPETPSCSRCASVSMGSARARSATTLTQLVEDTPPKNPPPSVARRSSASDITDTAGSAKRSLSVLQSRLDALGLPLHDDRPPSSINIRSPLEPGQSIDHMPDTSSSHNVNCLASPFTMIRPPPALESIPNPSSKQSHTTIKSTSPIASPTKVFLDSVSSMSKTPDFGVPAGIDRMIGLRTESDAEHSEHRALAKERAPDVSDMPKSNHDSRTASSASSRNVGVQFADTPSSKHVPLQAGIYLGTGDVVDLAQLQFAAFSHASNDLDRSTRGFGSVSSSSAFPSASLTTPELYEHDESEQRQTWTMFRPLIHLLLEARERGITRPSRSTIAVELVQQDKEVYRHVGVSKFRDYTALAERAGIIELGGEHGDTWIALQPNWFCQDGITTTHSLSDSDSSLTSDPPNAIQSALTGTQTSLTESPAVFPMPASAPPKADSFEYNTLLTAPTDRRSMLARFQPLIDILIRLRAEGVYIPLRSLVGQSLGQDFYTQAGVSGFKEYLQQALDAQLIQFGGVGGKAWVCLHPGLRI